MLSAIGLPRVVRPSSAETRRIVDEAEAALVGRVFELKSLKGTGQEQGGEADSGAGVNERREAIAQLMATYGKEALLALLPKYKGKLLKTIRADIDWIERAELQALKLGKPFDFSWSKNPMSTPKALAELSKRRQQAARESALALLANPEMAYDASNDSLLCHLGLENADLRAQVLADTLIQFRAKRRSEALMDGDKTSEGDALRGMVDGRMGSSGTVSAFEQRLALSSLKKGSSLANRRDYALTRLTVSSSPVGTVNGIFMARNAVALLPDYLGPGAWSDPIDEKNGFNTSIFGAIHANYSSNTPKAVDHYLRERVFTGGERADRVEILQSLLKAARAGSMDGARQTLSDLKERTGYEVAGLSELDSTSKLAKKIAAHLTKMTALSDLKTGLSAEGKLRTYEILLDVHRAVCQDRPTPEDLEKLLFYASSATTETAAFIHALRHGTDADQLEAAGRAREALRRAFFKAESGFERQMLVRLDRQVELLSAELLGSAVERFDASDESKALGEALLATRSALRGVLASDLDTIRRRKKTSPSDDLGDLLKELDALLKKKSVTIDEARSMMTKIFCSASEAADSLRGFFHDREGAIHFSDIDVDLDSEFSDNLVKETPLHYLMSLSQRGMTFGLKSEISENEIRLSGGARILNAVGPRVYKRVLQAKDPKALKKYKPPPGPDDLLVIRSSNQKDLVHGGGLILDAKHAGPGYSHSAVFAKGHGISAIALPDLDEAIEKFFRKASSGGEHPGFYVDDRAGSFVIKPLASALEDGLLDVADIERLRPGHNLEVDYFDVTEEGERILKDHSSVELSEHHESRDIELLIPDLENKLSLEAPPSLDALSEVPLDIARQNAGEKGAVLAALRGSRALQELGVQVPEGAVIPPALIAGMLKSAKVSGDSLYDHWQGAIRSPEFSDRSARLGSVDEPGILASLKKTTKASLKKLLLKGNAPTKAGRELLAALEKTKGLKGKAPWIVRSSFTGEDRPNKSGAGQYDSFPGCVSAKQRLEGVIGVIASAFNEGAVESNINSGIQLEHVWPSAVVQRCLAPTVSGVAVSRGVHGGFGEVSYQAKPKFGGGVDGGDAEEGLLRRDGSSLSATYKDEKASLLTKKQQEKLRRAILAIEEEFNERIEPGKKHAVDVEWAFVGDQLHILQARVITGV